MAHEQININVSDGEPFYAHEATINFTPTQLNMDFKCITPRSDPRSKKPVFHIKHNVVMVDPWHAKAFLGVLANSIGKYEEEFGKISKPKAITKAEKKQKDYMKKVNKKDTTPNYMG